jgi:hypothetical protein
MYAHVHTVTATYELGFPSNHIVHVTIFSYTVIIGTSILGNNSLTKAGRITDDELEARMAREKVPANFSESEGRMSGCF